MSKVYKETLMCANTKLRLDLGDELDKTLKFKILKNGELCTDLKQFCVTLNGHISTSHLDPTLECGDVVVDETNTGEFECELNLADRSGIVALWVDNFAISLHFDNDESRTLECWLE